MGCVCVWVSVYVCVWVCECTCVHALINHTSLCLIVQFKFDTEKCLDSHSTVLMTASPSVTDIRAVTRLMESRQRIILEPHAEITTLQIKLALVLTLCQVIYKQMSQVHISKLPSRDSELGKKYGHDWVCTFVTDSAECLFIRSWLAYTK